MIKNIQRLTQSFSHLRFSFARYVKKVNEKKPVEVEESEEFDEEQIKEGSGSAHNEKFLARKIVIFSFNIIYECAHNRLIK